MPGHNLLHGQLAPGGHLRRRRRTDRRRLGDPDERHSGGNLETVDRQSRVRRMAASEAQRSTTATRSSVKGWRYTATAAPSPHRTRTLPSSGISESSSQRADCASPASARRVWSASGPAVRRSRRPPPPASTRAPRPLPATSRRYASRRARRRPRPHPSSPEPSAGRAARAQAAGAATTICGGTDAMALIVVAAGSEGKHKGVEWLRAVSQIEQHGRERRYMVAAVRACEPRAGRARRGRRDG